MRTVIRNFILLIILCLCSCNRQDTNVFNSNKDITVVETSENYLENTTTIKQKETEASNVKYCDVSKFNKFEWKEVLNTIDTNDVEYDDLDEANKVLYKLYDSRLFGALIKDESFHKFFILHSDNVDDWKDIVKLDSFRESLQNDYYLYVVYENNDYKDIVRYDLIDGMSKMTSADIIESEDIMVGLKNIRLNYLLMKTIILMILL